jgi:ubiquitin carboxyl-terminal hydrolase 9/24
LCQKGSWGHASKKQREKLLELIRRLAEDDKEGVMAHKVLTLLWNLAQSEDVTTDIMDQALAAHIKILDYSCSQVCSQDRDSQKTTWIANQTNPQHAPKILLKNLQISYEAIQLIFVWQF